MPRARHDPPRGLLTLASGDPRVALGRYLPADPVAAFVEHYWTVRWRFGAGERFTSESLPYPSVHLVFFDAEWRVHGVTTGRFARTLSGAGMALGIKFNPGGFRPFIAGPVAELTDRVAPLASMLDLPLQEVVADPEVPDAVLVARCESILAENLPPPDPTVALLTRLCDTVAADRTIVRVDQLLPLAGLRRRALERLFHDYVGVSPKWVIQRYRLFEAADRLAAGVPGATVAADLGYFDQAHFIRDFKRLVGATPKSFAVSR